MKNMVFTLLIVFYAFVLPHGKVRLCPLVPICLMLLPVWIAYGETMKDDTFKEKVGRVSVREISRTARERRAGSLGFAEALLLEYNKKSKYSLPFEKLYTHKTPKKREPSTEDESGQSSTPEGQLDLFSTDQENTQALPNE